MKPRFAKRQERRGRRYWLKVFDRMNDWHGRWTYVANPARLVYWENRPRVSGADRTHYVRSGEWLERAS